MAEGLLRRQLEERGLKRVIRVESAGTQAVQPGRVPDARAQQVCRDEGIDIRRCRARRVVASDFERFDYILAMDRENYDQLWQSSPEVYRHRISHIGAWVAEGDPADIPDPYFGNRSGFETVFSMLQEPLQAFLDRLTADLDC